jgi:hypothetical protein
MNKYYSGIGSRETPDEMSLYIGKVVRYMNKKGYILRSGGASGADSFFETHLNRITNNCGKEIFLPWRDFNSNSSLLYKLTDEGFKLAEKYHPRFNGLSDGAKKLMVRNCYQVLGYDLKTPSSIVICWTKNGEDKGGTSQAIRIARDYNIPVVNLFDVEEAFEKIKDIIK